MGTHRVGSMPVHDFQSRGAGVSTPVLGRERAYIEQLRRNTFGIGDGKASKMAEILHRSIKHVSTEIYQNDSHFLSEILQNAEDNEYPPGVTPSLHLVLTWNDICKVGASATLVIFNNECGFTKENVEALCNIGYSTKKARGKPTEHQSGLPCLLNADFLLTSSRESIHFDSPWNQGIFDQVPKVFVSAFSIMVSSSRDGLMSEFLPTEAQTVYKFVPIKASPNRHFNKLRESAISALASSNVVLCYSKSISEKPPLLFPHQCRRLFKHFCEILKHAASTSQCGVSHFMTADLFIVDTEVQCKFGAQLAALGVVQFHPNEYFPLLGPWISKLQEEVYVEFLHFLASAEMGSASSDKLRARPLLKYVETSGSVGLASLSQTETLKIQVAFHQGVPLASLALRLD